MAALSIKPSYPTYFGTDGLPIENGYIYIGTAGLAAITNQISIYWDSALSVPATQPVRTIGGYPSRSGAPGMLYMNGTDYSILVADKNNVDVYSALNVTEASAGATANTAAIAVNTAAIAVNTAAIATNVTNIGLNTSKLAGIEAGADVTDSTNVDAAGAVMNSDTTTAAMSFVIDEDAMGSDSATKVPTQQSVKAYVDSSISSVNVGRPSFYASDSSPATSFATTSTTLLAINETNIGASAKHTICKFYLPNVNSSNWSENCLEITVVKAVGSTTTISLIVRSTLSSIQPTTTITSTSYGSGVTVLDFVGRTLTVTINRTDNDNIAFAANMEAGDDATHGNVLGETWIYDS